MHLASELGGIALGAALARIGNLPLPSEDVPSVPMECRYTDIPPYDDSVGKYDDEVRWCGDDEYVDAPYE